MPKRPEWRRRGLPELSAIRAWIEEFYPEVSFHIQRIEIPPKPCPATVPPRSYSKRKSDPEVERLIRLNTLFCVITSGFGPDAPNQSAQHGMLKWFAWNYLGGESDSLYLSGRSLPRWNRNGWNEPVRFEGGYQLLVPRDWKGSTFHGRRVWRVRYRGKLRIYVEMRADVLRAGNTAIECGDTTPTNLIGPLLEQVVKRTIWIPYPESGISFETTCPAFQFTLDRPQKGKALRIVKR